MMKHARNSGVLQRFEPFRLRFDGFGGVNWRLLHSLDLDRVIREGDVDMIQAHMENIAFARFSREDLEVTSDECIIKACRL